MVHIQNKKQFFFSEIIKLDKLSKTFYFIKISLQVQVRRNEKNSGGLGICKG